MNNWHIRFQKNKFNLVVWSSLFFHLVLFSYLTQAAELVAVVSNIPPWSIVENGSSRGIDIEIIETIAKKFGLKLKFEVCPWKRCLIMMKNGQADLMGTLLKSPEREIFMHYIEPPYWERSGKVFYLQKDRAHLLKKHEDLYDLTIGVLRGANYFPAFDDDPKIVKYEVAKPIQLLKMLQKGRIDAFIGAQLPMDYRLSNQQAFKGKFEKATYTYEIKSSVYMAISKKSQYAKRLPRFNKVMKQLVTGGQVGKIINGYSQALGK